MLKLRNMIQNKYFNFNTVIFLLTGSFAWSQFVEINAELDMRRLSEGDRQLFDTMADDIENSMDPQSAKELLEGVGIIKQERGGSKAPVEEEKTVIDFAFASVVSITEIKKGERFSRDNIWVKRPGTGPFYAKDYDRILGKIAANHINADKHIQHSDIQ